MVVENSKGECNLGQHEINFRYGDALRKADDHAIYKNGAKEIAAQEGYSITFMAKFNEAEGNSCHIHCSLAGKDGSNAFGADRQLFERFLAGQLACLREFTLLYAPHVNSYKRFVPGSFAPTAVAWGNDNRTCSMRVVGHGPSLRVENRLPGRRRQPLPRTERDDRRGPARDRRRAALGGPAGGQRLFLRRSPGSPQHLRLPRPVRRQRGRARGVRPEVMDHYLNRAQVEIDAFEAAVTDWEHFRGFERL